MQANNLGLTIERLVHPDETIRNHAIELVRTNVDPKITNWIVDELIRRLHFSSEPETAYAQQAIIGLGHDAIKRVSFQLVNSQDFALQLKLVRILVEIGLSIAPEDGPDVFFSLLTTANTSRSEAVVEACMQGITRIRWPNASQEEVVRRARYARATLVLPGMAQIAAACWVPQ